MQQIIQVKDKLFQLIAFSAQLLTTPIANSEKWSATPATYPRFSMDFVFFWSRRLVGLSTAPTIEQTFRISSLLLRLRYLNFSESW